MNESQKQSRKAVVFEEKQKTTTNTLCTDSDLPSFDSAYEDLWITNGVRPYSSKDES